MRYAGSVWLKVRNNRFLTIQIVLYREHDRVWYIRPVFINLSIFAQMSSESFPGSVSGEEYNE